MAMTTTPVSRKRCPLCLAILELTHVQGGAVATMKFQEHTAEKCEASTLQRIKVLEEMHHRDSYNLEQQSAAINDLGQVLGAIAPIVDAGRRWLIHRTKRAADPARLRNAFGTEDKVANNPLWEAEGQVAEAIKNAIELVEKRQAS